MTYAFPTSLTSELDRLILTGEFDVHFQPIANIFEPAILGFEALIRAPASTALHSPVVLFEVAASCGRLIELERLIATLIVRRFAQLGLPGRLFLNATADALAAAGNRLPEIRAVLQSAGVAAERIVVELTETRPVSDLSTLTDAITRLRELGLSIALDDLGEGFSSLRRWIDLAPDYVKIDRHFIDGVAGNPVKQRLVASILEMAASSGSAVIAEGIEQWADLDVLRRLGVSLCQGYLLARPSATPRTELRGDILSELLGTGDGPYDRARRGTAARTVGSLARKETAVGEDTTCAEVAEHFKKSPARGLLPVVSADGHPVGVLRGLAVLSLLSERFFLDLHGRKSCAFMMSAVPLCFDAGTRLEAVADTLSAMDERTLMEGFLVTDGGRLLGVGNVADLLRAMSLSQTAQHQHVHPLTGLPGNVAVDRWLTQLLERGSGFAVCHWNVRRYKAFNEAYGEELGDRLLVLLAGLLRDCTREAGDFLGHVGADHFVSVHSGSDWEGQCHRIAREFDQLLTPLVQANGSTPTHMVVRGRAGAQMMLSLPILVGAVIRCSPRQGYSLRKLSLAMANTRSFARQSLSKSGFVLERREQQAGGRR